VPPKFSFFGPLFRTVGHALRSIECFFKPAREVSPCGFVVLLIWSLPCLIGFGSPPSAGPRAAKKTSFFERGFSFPAHDPLPGAILISPLDRPYP